MLMKKEEDFIFHPPNFNENTLANFKENLIQIPTGRKNQEGKEEMIPCYFKKYPNSKTLLIFFHCNGGDMFGAIRYLSVIAKKFEMNLLIPEYPGYSIYKSPKSSTKCLEDSLIVYDFCLNNMKNLLEKNICIFGRSLGTGPAVYISSKRHPGGCFLLSPYTTFAEVGRKFHEEEFYNRLTKHLRSIDYIDKVECPLCIFHGREDNLIFNTEASKLYNQCKNNNKKELHLIEDMDHNNVFFFGKEMIELAREFINKYYHPDTKEDNISLDLAKNFYIYNDDEDDLK